MTRARVAPALGALAALTAVACGHSGGGDGMNPVVATHPSATAAATPTPVPGPPLPPEATQHLAPALAVLNRSLPPGAAPYRCDVPRGRAPGILSQPPDLSPRTPTTLRALAATATVIAVARADSHVSYWHQPAPGEPISPVGLVPQTATDLRVEQVLKGTAGAWMQVVQEGAAPGALGACDTLGWEVSENPPPKLGQEYVVFAQAALGGDRYAVEWGAYEMFPLVNGVVWTPSYVAQKAYSLPNYTAEPLQRFASDVSS